MLDLNLISRDEKALQRLQEVLRLRGTDPGIAGSIESLISEKRKIQIEVETLRSDRNKASKEIGILKQKGEDIEAASKAVKELGEILKKREADLNEKDLALSELNYSLPNLLQESVPPGKSEDDNVMQYTHGEKPAFAFAALPHFEIGTSMGILDFERGVKLAGARFYSYRGLGARLERALMNFMLDVHTKEHGYEEAWVPVLVNDECMVTTGQYPKFKDEYYRIDEGMNLIPTAEVPLTNLFRDEILSEDALPLSITAHTSCFRKEAGSYGKDTRGLVRVHQFQKVELVKLCKPEDSEKEHLLLLGHAENILKKLGLHYRVMLLCSKDTSDASSKTYDIEVWMPGLNRYMEISSVSNFQDFQARRGKIRYKSEDGKNQLVHTINGSGLAIGRTMAAVIENYQNGNGSFEIPPVLQKYM